MEGTLATKDNNGNLNISVNINRDLLIQLTPSQDLNIYKKGDTEELEIEKEAKEEINIKEFIESLPELSSGCFFISHDNRVSGYLLINKGVFPN